MKRSQGFTAVMFVRSSLATSRRVTSSFIARRVVFVATNDPNVFVMRPVRVGPESSGRAAVLEGLTVGERVVADGSFMLRAEWLKLHPGGADGPGVHQH